MATNTIQIETYEFESFRKMSAQEEQILRVLTNSHIDLSEFKKLDGGEIPEEIQGKIDYAKKHELFREIRVWHKTTPWQYGVKQLAGPKCYLVGVVKGEFQSTGELFLIGRWGEDLQPWDALKQLAIEQKQARILGDLKRMQSEVSRAIGDVKLSNGDEVLAMGYCYANLPTKSGYFITH